MIDALLASAVGVGVATATATAITYKHLFVRCNRPDYALTPGEYCYSRVKDRLSREKFFYNIKGKKLCGYYYPTEKCWGIAVFCHGMRSGADDYIPLIEQLVLSGVSVFAYDCTGTYDSPGKNTVGMGQQMVDLKFTVDYLTSRTELRRLPIFLIGHSWGAYASAAVLSLVNCVSGCVAIAGMNNGTDIMVAKAKEMIGPLAFISRPVFLACQKLAFGDYVDLTAVDGINSSGASTLIAHGIGDRVVRFNGQSIIAKRKKITNPSVKYYIGKGLRSGHSDIMYSEEAIAYRMEIQSEILLREMKTGRRLSANDKAELYRSIDHRLYSRPNRELVELIISTFREGL